MIFFNNGENEDKKKRKRKKKKDKGTWVTLPNFEYQREIGKERVKPNSKEKIPLPPKKKHKAERGKNIDKKKKNKE